MEVMPVISNMCQLSSAAVQHASGAAPFAEAVVSLLYHSALVKGKPQERDGAPHPTYSSAGPPYDIPCLPSDRACDAVLYPHRVGLSAWIEQSRSNSRS
jgi:hypothetical protein